jgi:hypothetical protein
MRCARPGSRSATSTAGGAISGGRRDDGRALPWVLGAVGAVVAVLVVVFLLFGQLAQLGSDDVAVQEIREGSLTADAYEAVQLGAVKEDVLLELRPVLPVDTRVVDRYEQREPATVAGECVYYERYGGRTGELFRFCFEQDVPVDKTVLLAGDPGPGSAVVDG